MHFKKNDEHLLSIYVSDPVLNTLFHSVLIITTLNHISGGHISLMTDFM